MRHKLLPATTIILWIINSVIVVAEHSAWPHIGDYDSGQRLLIGITVVVTIAWLLHRHGIEYRIGYREGRKDSTK